MIHLSRGRRSSRAAGGTAVCAISCDGQVPSWLVVGGGAALLFRRTTSTSLWSRPFATESHSCCSGALVVTCVVDVGQAPGPVSGVCEALSEVDVAELFRTHAGAAHGIAYRVLGDRDLAAEAVQDAFLSMWRCRHAYRPDHGDMNVWVWTLVHRRAVDLLRRRSRQPATSALYRAFGSHLVARQPGPEKDACDADQRARILAAIRQLAPLQRQTILLAFDGHTQVEIARLLDVPLGTVKTRMLCGKRALRRLVPRETLI